MSTNILIKIFEIILFGGFLLHVIYALILQIQNWIAQAQAGTTRPTIPTPRSSRNL